MNLSPHEGHELCALSIYKCRMHVADGVPVAYSPDERLAMFNAAKVRYREKGINPMFPNGRLVESDDAVQVAA